MVKFVSAAAVLAAAVVLCVEGASAAGESCEVLRARYKAGFTSLVGEVKQKSPALLVRYAVLVGTGVPSRSQALGALSDLKPACVDSLGAAECTRLIARARAFIDSSHRLNTAYGSAGCPGRLDG